MAAPIINNLMLFKTAVLILPDKGNNVTTGTVARTAVTGSANLFTTAALEHPSDVGTHVLFVRNMSTEVEIDEVEYLAMPIGAIVGITPIVI